MIIRNGNYTLYQGQELIIIESRDEVPTRDTEKMVSICYSCQANVALEGFIKHPYEVLFCKGVYVSELRNAFFLQTYGHYNGHTVKVFSIKNNETMVYITTIDKDVASKYSFFDMQGHFGKDVVLTELGNFWEEKTESTFATL